MQQTRKTLSLRSAAAEPSRPDAAPGEDIVRLAIDRRMCVMMTYNKTLMQMAPHILFTKHGDPFVDGVVMERNGRAPRELKMGTFKLAGLTDLVLTANRFDIFEGYDSADPKYAEATLSAVQA